MAVAPLPAIVPAAAHLVDRTRHHIGIRLLPFLFILYITNYLDRTSVAYAAVGMSRDLGFSDRVLGMGMGIFFITYVALQIPGALLVERWSARRMISTTMIAWGSLTALTALVHTPAQLYLARFLLGAAEAGYFPGVIVYLSHWFIREDRGKATSNFMAAIPHVLRHWIAHRGLDSRAPAGSLLRVALALRPGRDAGYRAGHRCILLLNGLAARGDLARSRAAAMGGTKAARRKTSQHPSDLHQTGPQVPHHFVTGLGNLSQLFCELQLLLLVPHHAEASIRIF